MLWHNIDVKTCYVLARICHDNSLLLEGQILLFKNFCLDSFSIDVSDWFLYSECNLLVKAIQILCSAYSCHRWSKSLNVSWRRSLSYRNQSVDLQSKSLDWFLYDRDFHHERIKVGLFLLASIIALQKWWKMLFISS